MHTWANKGRHASEGPALSSVCPTSLLKTHCSLEIWCVLCLLLCVLISHCLPVMIFYLSPQLFLLCFTFASGDWGLWPRETPWRLQLQVPVFPKTFREAGKEDCRDSQDRTQVRDSYSGSGHSVLTQRHKAWTNKSCVAASTPTYPVLLTLGCVVFSIPLTARAQAL